MVSRRAFVQGLGGLVAAAYVTDCNKGETTSAPTPIANVSDDLKNVVKAHYLGRGPYSAEPNRNYPCIPGSCAYWRGMPRNIHSRVEISNNIDEGHEMVLRELLDEVSSATKGSVRMTIHRTNNFDVVPVGNYTVKILKYEGEIPDLDLDGVSVSTHGHSPLSASTGVHRLNDVSASKNTGGAILFFGEDRLIRKSTIQYSGPLIEFQQNNYFRRGMLHEFCHIYPGWHHLNCLEIGGAAESTMSYGVGCYLDAIPLTLANRDLAAFDLLYPTKAGINPGDDEDRFRKAGLIS